MVVKGNDQQHDLNVATQGVCLPFLKYPFSKFGFFKRNAGWILFKNLVGKNIHRGRLDVEFLNPNGSIKEKITFGDPQAAEHQHGIIRVLDKDFFWPTVVAGEIHLGQAFIKGMWDSPHLYRVMIVLMLNEQRLRNKLKLFHLFTPIGKMIHSTVSFATSNKNRNHNKKYIHHTYDIGNDFYRIMLGPTMQYSCAIWATPEQTLEEAQENKMDIIIRKMRIDENTKRVIDVGCGFGTLCARIKERYPHVEVTGITLSSQQIDECKKRYGSNIHFYDMDWRQIEGTFDRIVSVGMMEHVARQHMDEFVNHMGEHLVEGGRAVFHHMSYHDDMFVIDGKQRKYENSASILMPNADAPTLGQMAKAGVQSGIMRLVHSETFGIHYSRTAEHWLENIQKQKSKIIGELGYSEEVFRAHEYSWCFGRAAMETGTSLLHTVFERVDYGNTYKNAIL